MISFLLGIVSRLANATVPPTLLTLALGFAVATFFRLLVALDFATLTSWERFADAWFARLWVFFGPISTAGEEEHVAPIVGAAYGRVIDVGPGSGLVCRYFDKSKLTKVYGVEPNRRFHPVLRRTIKDLGLEDVYEILDCGAEDLGRFMEKESIDCIVTVKVLCGVPTPEKVIKQLYGYLKPGGTWLVFEHVKNSKHFLTRKYQDLLQLLWPHMLGGCNINRVTQPMLVAAGEWEKVELAPPAGEKSWYVVPHTMGRLMKPGKTEDVAPPVGEVKVGTQRNIRRWWGEQDMGYFVLVYCALSYCFWGFIEAMK